METTINNLRSIDNLEGIFSSEQIRGLKSIWEVTEHRLKEMENPTIKENYAKFGWESMLDLLRGLEPDTQKVILKFKQMGITGVKISDQVVRISEKLEGKEDTFLIK